MPQTATQESGSGFRARDLSPNSLIFNAESNFSLFSSASCSVERCSFTSDAPDQDSLASEVSQHLVGHDAVGLSGPDLDPIKPKLVYKNNVKLSRKGKTKDSSEAETTEDENLAIVSARNSFSRALRECQNRRLRSEGLLNKSDRRTASLDLNISVSNSANSSSPRFGVMKKPSAATGRSNAFPSPGTPNYWHPSIGIQKGWSSERIPTHTYANKRSVNTSLFPYHNGRTLPSKWEDAERWIFSPVSGDGSIRASTHQPQRRPRSKSGPLGPPGTAYYQMFSPAAPVSEGGNTAKLIANSPFSAGVLAADGLWIRNAGRGGNANFIVGTDRCMARSISIHGCSEMVSQSSLAGHQDENCNGFEDAANNISRDISRRDMATQMSPDSSIQSSSERRSSFSLATPSILPLVEFESKHASKPEIRDVPVDEPVTMTRWSKKNRSKNFGRGCGYTDDWKRKAVNFGSATWEVSVETSKSISTIRREEARITAWENLQKAKAEAAIRKLEMKLEKKRSSSMDKIMNKLRYAQKKAQDMRSSVITNQAHQIERPSDKALSFRRTRQIGLSGCFTCHAF
ncbi:hypothetical protein F511_01374 [Dorcoceras hygrometricum]|uniref:Remorin C-terminal domain-containing protein n=1 Tax=Dorcoceras hygrometricum TaxID=472368 RepID=A0A2Z7DBE6_9LAMI|nr:hypothetical protein F511_01374 [Dorcoceras hygrometricum]